MSYRNLYRRWRPNRFLEVTGQEHITRTLSHALSRENVSHAYLFCGPRGTGKTTVAKIMAKALNCYHFPVAEPCNECKPCLDISRGAFMDVLELDAASNRGIEEVRELREKSRYATSKGKHSVYIVDEAHMLTHEAFNALLKTLEEPPPGVVFILATTEPSKLPPTVISRCQRFDFRLLSEREIVDRMQEIAAAEKWSCQQEALQAIARLSEGALRDALSLLEQCQVYAEEEVNLEHVYDLTGLPPEESLGKLLEALVQQEVLNGIQAIREVTYGGKDLHLLVKEQLYLFTQMLLAQSTTEESVLNQEGAYQGLIKQYLDRISYDGILEVISLLHQLSGELKYYQNPHFHLEIAFINMIKSLRRLENSSPENLYSRLVELEEKMEAITGPARSYLEVASEKQVSIQQEDFEQEITLTSKQEPKKPEPSPEPKTDNKQPAEAQDQELSPSNISMDEKETFSEERESKTGDFSLEEPDLQEAWSRILKSIKNYPLIAGLLETARPLKLEKNILTLSFSKDHSIHLDLLEKYNNRKQTLEQVASEIFQKKVAIKGVISENNHNANKEIQNKEEHKNIDNENNSFYAENVSLNNSSHSASSVNHAFISSQETKETKEAKEAREAKEATDTEKVNHTKMSQEALRLFSGKLISTDEEM